MTLADKLKAALEKAGRAGVYEERAVIAGIEMAFRNLTNTEYISNLNDIQNSDEMTESEFSVTLQISMIARSLIELDGLDLRGVEYFDITDDQGAIKKVEKFQWVYDLIMASWSQEMSSVAYRKVIDANEGAERLNNSGVVFSVESEHPEDQYHRLLSEISSLGAALPLEVKEPILLEHGLLLASTPEELEILNQQSKAWLAEEIRSSEEKVNHPSAPEEPAPPKVNPPVVVPVGEPTLKAPAGKAALYANIESSAAEAGIPLGQTIEAAYDPYKGKPPVVVLPETPAKLEDLVEVNRQPTQMNPKYSPPRGGLTTRRRG
jgi:hypothetical protein